MSGACTSEPISCLRLERYLLAELPSAERERVASHLAACSACRGSLDALRACETALKPLDAPVEARAAQAAARGLAELERDREGRRARWSQTAVVAIGSGLALAAALSLALHGALTPAPQPAADRDALAAVKGGELALELVRERAGDVARDPRSFVPGDRFAAFVSCAPGQAPYWDLAVFQGGQAFFPLAPQAPLVCGNAVQLPGAFLLDGTAPATVCVLIARERAIDRARLARASLDELPFEHACQVIAPARE